MKYCLGFLINQDYSQVLLLRKERPVEQQGRLNGVGGKVEDNETAVEAMRRECLEEVGLDITDWQAFGETVIANSDSPKITIAVFYAYADLESAKSLTDETIEICNVADLEARKDELVTDVLLYTQVVQNEHLHRPR